MEFWQNIFLITYAFINLLISIKGFYECKYVKNSYKLTPILNLLGIFVWGDAVIFGPFWTITATASYFIKNWFLFLLTMSVFWFVRSLGETIYWFNQQFSNKELNPPKKLFGYSIFQNDSIWYVYQIFWQCITVVSIIFVIYFSKLWLKGL